MTRPSLLSPEGQRRLLAEMDDGMSEAEAAELHALAAELEPLSAMQLCPKGFHVPAGFQCSACPRWTTCEDAS